MAITRQFCFGIDPYTAQISIANSYSWAAVADNNSLQKSLSCAYAPRTKGTLINPLPDAVILGTVGASLTMRSFRADLSQDDGSNITGTLITSAIDPTRVDNREPDKKRFMRLEFPRTNPFALGLSIYFCKDVEDPLGASTTWIPLTFSSTDVRTFFPSGIARWIHLKFVDTTSMSMRAIFGGFRVYYYSLGSREDE